MGEIRVLDCTLRDGGFVNDWNFGHHAIYNIFTRLAASNIEIIEVGFLNESYEFDINRSIMPNSKFLPTIFNMETKKKPMLVAMIILGECKIENVDLKENSLVDAIRVVFKKSNIEEGLKLARQIKEKGYEIFLQPASVTDYSDEEMMNLVEAVNDLNPIAMYIVDTYGLMHSKEVSRYFQIMDKNLKNNISIGFHSHNNLQMSYSSSIDLLEMKTERNVIIDSSLFGMGKGTGNLNTELITDYLNKHHYKDYDVMQILEIIDLEILKLKEIYGWGYSLVGFIAASNDCHPKYVEYLINKRTLSVKAVNIILSRLEDGRKTIFDGVQIEKLYIEYQSREIDDSLDINCLAQEISNREILIMAPGSSLNREMEKIKSFINEKNPIIIAINHNPVNYAVDYYFINNAKRYSQMAEFLEGNHEANIIATSNITPANMSLKYCLNFSQLLVKGDQVIISGNATLMLFNALMRIGIKKVNVAGFDGFLSNSDENYVEKYLSYNKNNDVEKQNNLIREAILIARTNIDINFITKSHYEL